MTLTVTLTGSDRETLTGVRNIDRRAFAAGPAVASGAWLGDSVHLFDPDETASSVGATCSSSSIMNTTVTTVQWLSVGGNGSATGGQSLQASVAPAGLAAGTYRADLNIVAQGVTYDVAIYLAVRGAPPAPYRLPTRSADRYRQRKVLRSPVAVLLRPGFSSTVQIAVSSDLSWLNVTPPSTNAGASYSVSANPVGLQTGTYFGTVVLTDFAGDVSVASVVLTVRRDRAHHFRAAAFRGAGCLDHRDFRHQYVEYQIRDLHHRVLRRQRNSGSAAVFKRNDQEPDRHAARTRIGVLRGEQSGRLRDCGMGADHVRPFHRDSGIVPREFEWNLL